MRLIDADRLKAVLEKNFGHTGGASVLEQLIDAQPTIQSQSTAGQLNDSAQSTDLIDRQAVIDELRKFKPEIIPYEKARIYVEETVKTMYDRIVEFPTIQPEPSIPVTWIEKYIEWLKSFDNEFANLEAAHISVMVKKWRDEQNDNKGTY